MLLRAENMDQAVGIFKCWISVHCERGMVQDVMNFNLIDDF